MIDAYLPWRDRIAEALDQRFWPLDWLDEQILQERALAIATDKACIVIEIRTYPGGAREVHGLVAAGDLETIIGELIPAAEAFGAENGCGFGCVASHPAWSKLLKSSGYRVHQMTLRKEL